MKPASWAEGIEETFPNLDFRFVPGARHFVPFKAPEETVSRPSVRPSRWHGERSLSSSAPSQASNFERSLPAARLGLRFKQMSFGLDIEPSQNYLSPCFREDLGRSLESRIALRWSREAPFGPSRRASTGFRRLGRCAELGQKRRNYAMDPRRCQASAVVVAFPGQPQVRHMRPRQPKLGESGQNQPRPPVGLLGVPYPRCAPSQSLFEKAESMLQVEAPDV